MKLDLVTPERQLASVEITAVQIPGQEGDLTVMPNHAPVITTLRPGVVRVQSTGGTDEYLVTGGFAEITPDTLSILAEVAIPKSEATRETLEAVLEEAKAGVDIAADLDKPAARLRVNDVTELMKHMS